MKFLRFWKLQETVTWLHYVSFWLDYCGYIIQNSGCTLDVLYCLLLHKDHMITSNLQHGSYVGVRAVLCRWCLAVGLTSTKWLQSRMNIMIIWASSLSVSYSYSHGAGNVLQKMWVIKFHSLISLAFCYTFPNFMLKNGEDTQGLNSSD